MNALNPTIVEFKHSHFFCGIGAAAKGFNRGHARVGSFQAKFRCIGGLDVDPGAIRNFTRLAGVEGTVIDLFNREQYIAFHGHEPPAGWREATIADIHRAHHYERPDVIFLSAPCKGFSGLLPEASSKTDKYQALNGLTLRGVWLMLEAFKDDPPQLIVFENVPRIAVRGRHLLDQICSLLRSYGYAVAETTHDCGELGGLAQSRKRFLLVARHEKKVPPFLYEPPKKRLRGVGEVLEKLPLPGDERGGPMHRMPSLQWKTWVRLAFVEAGSDWRSLNKLNVADGVLTDFAIMPDEYWQHGVLGVRRWDEPTGVVPSRSGPTNGAHAVADPRLPDASVEFKGGRVVDWVDRAGAITTQRSPGSSAQSVADPRIDGHEKSVQMGVGHWDQPAAVVKGDVSVGTGRYAVSDPRHHGRPLFNNVFRIVPWEAPSPAVAGPGAAAGGVSVADPRLDWNENAHASKLAVQAWEQPGRTVGGSRFGSGGGAVADPRPGKATEDLQGNWHVTPFDEPAHAVVGNRKSGASAVADPRPSQREDYKQTKYRVTGMDEASGAVIAASSTGNGAFAVADPRPLEGLRNGALGVHDLNDTAGVVGGESLPSNGAFAVADPRPVGLQGPQRRAHSYDSQAHYGVARWEEPSLAVPGHARHDAGKWSIADPREQPVQELYELPKGEDRLVAVIRALDNTWHRPFTTLELAALQSLVDPDEMFTLEGKSDSMWREWIGNAVPSDAAEAVASVMGHTLLLALTGETFVLSADPIWVSPLMIALSVDHSPNAGLLD